MSGDQTLFHRMDIVEAGWHVVDPILRAWQAETAAPPVSYARGANGPPEADLLLDRDGRFWRC
jgi:glucose-6-phosphate 1-dehydrogenase